jgi:hypothetical protein
VVIEGKKKSNGAKKLRGLVLPAKKLVKKSNLEVDFLLGVMDV